MYQVALLVLVQFSLVSLLRSQSSISLFASLDSSFFFLHYL